MKNRHEVTGDAVVAGGLPNDGKPGNPNSGTENPHPAPAPEADVADVGSPKRDTDTRTDAEKEVGTGNEPA